MSTLGGGRRGDVFHWHASEDCLAFVSQVPDPARQVRHGKSPEFCDQGFSATRAANAALGFVGLDS